jgi:hypothetical protein
LEDAVDWRHRPPQVVKFPSPIVPDGSGTMSLTAAAHWIASEGGKRTITDAHENEWLLAFDELVSAIHSAKFDFNLIGRSRQSGKYESVLATYLNDRPREYQFLSTSARNPRLSEAADAKDFLKFSFDWSGRHNDTLFVTGLSEWTHLQVNMTAVAASWPFGLALASVPQPARLTPATPQLATESVRREPRASKKAGKPEAYNWRALVTPLNNYVQDNGQFESHADLNTWCRDHVELHKGRRRPKGDGPDTKTVKAAILKCGLDKIALRPVED